MKKPIFKGAAVAIITPYTEDGINFPELGRIIEDQIKGGTDAIVITGTTGESATMSDAEHRDGELEHDGLHRELRIRRRRRLFGACPVRA